MKRDIFLLIIIITISIFPRVWQLKTSPPMIVDEPANLRDIGKLQSYKSFHPIDYEWGFGQATLVHYPALLIINLGLEELTALRLTSVVLSLLTLIPFYFVVKKRTNELVAFCTTIIFSFSYYYLQFSRVGWTNIHPISLGLYLFWLIDLALEKKSLILIGISGLLAGLLMYTYRSGQIYILAGFLMLLLGLAKVKSIQIKMKNLAVFTLFFITIASPWVIKILSNLELYNLRARVVAVSNASLPYHGLLNYKDIWIYQVITVFKSWILMLPVNGGGIENPRYLPLNHGVVSPFVATLFLIGLILALRKFKQNAIWLIIYFVGLFFGQIMTVDPPNGSRGLLLLPVIYIFSGLTLHLIYKRFKENKLIVPALVILSATIAYIDFLFYQNWMTWIKVF